MDFLYLLGSINSFFLSLVVVFSRKTGKRAANRFLFLLLISWSYGFFYTYLIETRLYLSIPHILLVGAPFTFLTGPCIFLYARFLIDNTGKCRNRCLFHFLPFLLHTIYLLPFYFKQGTEKIRFWETERSFGSAFFVLIYLQLFHLLLYLLLTLLLVKKHAKDIGNTYSFREGIDLAWLRNLIGLSFAGLSSYCLVLVFFLLSSSEGVYVNKVSDLFLVIVLHLFGFFGLIQPEIFHAEEKKEKKKYEKSALSDADSGRIVKRLEQHMSDTSPFLDNELRLSDLAEELEEAPHYISQALNSCKNMNFFEFVNRYRVRYAEDLLKQKARNSRDKRNLLDIAFESGFNSKSSFNSLFKKYSGMTPREFAASLKVLD